MALVAFEPQQLVERWCIRIRQPGRQGITRVPGSKLGQVRQLLDDLRPRSADLSESDLGFGDDERLLSLERVGAAANAGGDALHFSRYASVADDGGGETVPQGVASHPHFSSHGARACAPLRVASIGGDFGFRCHAGSPHVTGGSCSLSQLAGLVVDDLVRDFAQAASEMLAAALDLAKGFIPSALR